jgi:hypothetical protein
VFPGSFKDQIRKLLLASCLALGDNERDAVNGGDVYAEMVKGGRSTSSLSSSERKGDADGTRRLSRSAKKN